MTFSSLECPDYSISKVEHLLTLAKLLRGSHHILQCNGEVGFDMCRQNPCLMEFLACAQRLCERHLSPLIRLFSSQYSTFQSNELIRICSTKGTDALVDNLRKSSLLGGSEGSSDLDAVPLAYNDRRDSRNTGAHQLVHANQQKLRDRIHEWIRQWATMGASAANRTANEVLLMVHPENFFWLSEVLLNEFEQLERQKSNRDYKEDEFKAIGRSKLERLEDRITKLTLKSAGLDDEENAVISFISFVDSARLCQALQSLLFDRIEGLMHPIIDGTNRMEPRFSSDIQRLAGLGRLLTAMSTQVVGRYEDPVLCFCREALLEAETHGYMLATLPWILTWLRGCPIHIPAMQRLLLSVQRRLEATMSAQETLCANQIALLLLFNAFRPLFVDIQSEKWEELYAEKGHPTDVPNQAVFGNKVDEDESLLGLERILSHCIPEYRLLVSEIALICTPLNNSGTMVSPTTFPSVSCATQVKPPRKVRPITESAPGALNTGQNQIQKRLRQWFWWQYPILKELLLDTLPRYLASGEKLSLKDASRRLWMFVPSILPPALRGNRQMEELVISLVLESIQSITIMNMGGSE